MSNGAVVDNSVALWRKLDAIDLRNEIEKGRILLKIQEAQGWNSKVFDTWCRDNGVSKIKARQAILISKTVDQLVYDGVNQSVLKNFSKAGFLEASKLDQNDSTKELCSFLCDEAEGGEIYISKEEARAIAGMHLAAETPLFSDKLKAKLLASNGVKPKVIAPLVRLLEQLPESSRTQFIENLDQDPSATMVRHITAEAKMFLKYMDTSSQATMTIDRDAVGSEAIENNVVPQVSKLARKAAQFESYIIKAHRLRQEIAKNSSHLSDETANGSPNISKFLNALEALNKETVEIKLNDKLGESVECSFSRTKTVG